MRKRTARADKIQPRKAYYIKLGRGGKWERESLERGIIRFGFKDAPHDVCERGEWESVRSSYQGRGFNKATAANIANQIHKFYEANETVLWITFADKLLWWCFSKPSVTLHPDGEGRIRRTVNGWSCRDVNGELLTADSLTGALLKVQGYRSTLCDVRAFEYLVRRINGELLPEVQRAKEAAERLNRSIPPLMRLLTWQDFELLVDLVFANSGWRRLGAVGKTEKTLDIDMILPTTGERAFVQVKSAAKQTEFEDYIERLHDLAQYDRMFFVWHTGELRAPEDATVTLIGPDRLAKMVMDAGLFSWLLRKVS